MGRLFSDQTWTVNQKPLLTTGLSFSHEEKWKKGPQLKILSWADFDRLESNSIYTFMHENKKKLSWSFFSLNACSASMCHNIWDLLTCELGLMDGMVIISLLRAPSVLIICDSAHWESCPLWEDCSQTRLGLRTPLLWRHDKHQTSSSKTNHVSSI